MENLLNKYLATLDPADMATGRRLITRSLDQGTAPEAVIDQVLVPAQVEVGRRWQANEYTVPQEHAATAVTDAVLASMAARTPGDRSIPGRIVACCVEGEWHTLPLRMLTDSLTMHGHDVVFLGPSVPAAQLAGFLREVDPVALLVSCTAASGLVGARRTIEAAHAAGVPVLIGGRGIGVDGTRADNLGADAWTTNVTGAEAVLAAWARRRPELSHACDVEPEEAGLEHPRPSLVDDCLSVLLERQPELRAMTGPQMERTREDLAFIMQFCSAALVCRDPTVLDDFTVWLRDLLAPRGVPATSIVAGYDAIAEVLAGDFPVTVRMLAASSETIATTPPTA